MSLPVRILAVSGALLLAGCRHKPPPAAKPTPIAGSVSNAARPDAQSDPLTSLRPRLAETMSKVQAAAGPLGLLGWPGVATTEGSDELNPTLERKFFHNDRALVFVDKTNGRYSAFVLMPESKSPEELHYWPVWVEDLFGSPRLEAATFENSDRNKFDGSDGLWWEGGDSTKRDAPQTDEEVRLYAKEPFLLVAGTRASDAAGSYLAGATPTILDCIDGITDAQGLIEGFPADAQPEMDGTLPHKDMQTAQKLGETKRFMWFAVGGKKYATEKSDWETWVKGPQPSTIKDPMP